MHLTVATLFLVLLMAACTVPYSTPATQTAPTNSQNCAYVWATQPLPDLTEKVQAAINAAGLAGVNATAEAFGENCIDPQTNKTRSFATMETDFHITAKVTDLTNTDNLGKLLEKILPVRGWLPGGKDSRPAARQHLYLFPGRSG